MTYRGNSAHHFFSTNKNSKPNYFFCIGHDEEMEHVTSVYIIPNDDYVNALSGIGIPYDKDSTWDIFKESEKEICSWSNLFHTLKLKNCTVLRKS